MTDADTYIPYCGLAPVQEELWQRWNLDPVLIGVLLTVIAWNVRNALVRDTRVARWALPAGWSAVIIGFVSPLCALGVALFSARVTQHMWLTLVAAPLLVWARAVPSVRLPPWISAALFAVVLWAWHLPAAYEATFRSDGAYWAMHLSLLAAAALAWQRICFSADAHWLARLGSGFFTLLQMALLGALITLTPRQLYLPHVLSAADWGLTALEDQQLGGLIMWVPAGAVLLIAALLVLAHGLGSSTSAQAAPSQSPRA